MPFVSNRMESDRVGATVTVPLPRVQGFQYWAIYSRVLGGRNVGQANTATVGMTYVFNTARSKGAR